MFTFGIVCLVYIISVAYKCHFLYQSFIYFCLYRILRHGLEVTEMAVSELPGNPVSVWTARTNVLAEFDAYIIVSFINATLVLSIGETVEEVTDSGFLGTTPTINCCQLGEDTLVQVCLWESITIMITENVI